METLLIFTLRKMIRESLLLWHMILWNRPKREWKNAMGKRFTTKPSEWAWPNLDLQKVKQDPELASNANKKVICQEIVQMAATMKESQEVQWSVASVQKKAILQGTVLESKKKSWSMKQRKSLLKLSRGKGQSLVQCQAPQKETNQFIIHHKDNKIWFQSSHNLKSSLSNLQNCLFQTWVKKWMNKIFEAHLNLMEI